jgi:hypothetical protein
MMAAPNQAPKLKRRTTAREKCFWKQRNATRKKRMLGRIAEISICGFPGKSTSPSNYYFSITKMSRLQGLGYSPDD